MTSEGLGVMFEGDSADMCAGKFPLVSMSGRAEGFACADRRARTPIGASGNLLNFHFILSNCSQWFGTMVDSENFKGKLKSDIPTCNFEDFAIQMSL